MGKPKKSAALKDKNESTNEVNIIAGKLSDHLPSPVVGSDKENHESLLKGGKKGKKPSSFEKELKEMQEMLEKMKIEKEKTEDLLKEKDEILKKKEEEIGIRDEEIKMLKKIKEFKPVMTLPVVQSLKDKELEKKDKKKKECPERKRPASAYALWCKDQWTEMKKENPNADFKEVSNLIAAKWKSLSAEEKKVYEERHQADKEAYLRIVSQEKRESEAMKLLEEEKKHKTAMELLDQYIQFQQGVVDKGNKKTKKEKDPLKPKQPVTAFLLYSKDRRSVLLEEGKKLLETSKLIGEEWKNMTQEQKLPYEEIAKANKEKYQKEMEIYNKMKAEEAERMKKEEEEMMKVEKAEALQLLKKKEKTDNIIKKTKEEMMMKKKQKDEKNVDPNKPKKPATSFLLFSNEERKKIRQEKPDVSASVINTLVSMKWKEMKEEEKVVWNDKAAEAMEAYKKEMEEYNKHAAELNTDNNKSS